MKDTETIAKQLKSKELQLKKILQSQFPCDPALAEAHVRRQRNAKAFLKDLNDISYVVNLDLNIELVSKSTLQKRIKMADIATVDFDGEYCKLVIIQNFPEDDNLWLLWVAPVSSV